MIAGPAASGQTFELLQFNDKHPSTNPVTGNALTPTPFYSNSIDLSVENEGSALPYLNLSRVFVLTSADTCSVQTIMNELRGIDIGVIQIGGTTPEKTLRLLRSGQLWNNLFLYPIQGVNAKGLRTTLMVFRRK